MSILGLDVKNRLVEIVEILRKSTEDMVEPASFSIVTQFGKQPFLVLISCILSLRTKDTVSLPASVRLFQLAKTPQQMLQLSVAHIEKLIYPVGFYRNKAKNLHEISRDLIERFDGKVPNNEKDLLSFKGVGRKTANLVLAQGFDIPAICVDTHVHRISNRLGVVSTKTTDQTESELHKILPKVYWREYNSLLVMWGQNICVPISPFCSRCALAKLCKKVGVKKER